MAKLLLRPRIEPFIEGGAIVRASYAEAHKTAAPQGGLPLNIHADRLLIDRAHRKTLKPKDLQAATDACPLWIGELVVFRPAEGFLSGQVIHDSATGFFFSAIPDNAVGRPVHLLVRPASSWRGEGEIVPASVSLLHDLPASGYPGRVDLVTGFPYEVSSEILAGLPVEQVRFAFYDRTFSVAPVARDANDFYDDDRRDVVLDSRPSGGLGVARVAIDLIELDSSGRLAKEHRRDLQRETIAALSHNENPEALNVVLQTMNREERDALVAQATAFLAAA